MSRYSLGPFEFESEIALPELRQGSESDLRRIPIQLGPTPQRVEQGVAVDRFCTVSPTEYLLDIPEVARFHVANGTRVTVERHPGAVPADVRLYLLGSVFGALCHQNGLLPLHASAVEKDGRVTAFLGHSGAGKSTLAAFLGRRGFRIVSDDICLLDGPASGTSGDVRVIPVAGWLKLWRQSLDVLGEAAEEGNRLLSKDDKFRVYLGHDPARQLTLRNVVLIERPEPESAPDSPPASAPKLEALGAHHAIVGLMEMTYLAYIPESTGEQANLFRRCSAVLNRARPFRLTAPLGWDRMAEVLDLIERRLLD